MIHVQSHVVGLIGRGIGASRSPRIHENEAAQLGLPLAYRIADFTALGLQDADLEHLVRLISGMGYSGSNVTFPFKQSVLPLCSSVSDAAATLGAVNTLVFRDGEIRGENTDWVGFSWLIEREFGDITGSAVAQVGAGGAGSATAYALAQLGAARIAVFDPDRAKAQEMVDRLTPHFPACHFSIAQSAEAAISGCDGIVNATPIGMASIGGMPFDARCMASEQWLADIIYFPLETELVAAARHNRQTVANGVSMVVGQAAEAFRLITGVQPDRDRMLGSLLASIASERAQEEAA